MRAFILSTIPAGAVLVTASSVLALEINPANYDPQINNRFASGYTTTVTSPPTPITAPPTPNTSPLFLGYGYDLSGIGWNTKDTQQSRVLISPMNYASAAHDPLKLSSTSLTFLGNDSQLHQATVASVATIDYDAALGTLAAPIPASSQVGYVAILDLGDNAAAFNGQPLLVYGKYGKVGSAHITRANAWRRPNEDTSGNTFSYDSVGVRDGDSGSPSLIPYAGQLTLAGTHWTSSSLTGYAGGGDSMWVNPYAIAMANVVMAPSGYAVKVIAVPTKNWSGAVSSDFRDARNWAEGAAPTREGIAFDGSAASGHYDISLGGASDSVSLKGIAFSAATSSHGFTLSGSLLKLGTGGIINNNAQTQTFNNPISMYYRIDIDSAVPAMTTGAQHWSANAGDLAINGSVANNGFQLVVDGAKNTVIHGVIRGAGGLGKEGTGQLTLTQANLYTGRTTVTDGTLLANNAAGSATGGAVLVWTGTLAGSGTIGGAVTIKAGGTLAPGDPTDSVVGKLTLNNGVTLASGAHFAARVAGGAADQLVVTGGNVDLASATLDLTALGTADGTAPLWIVNNTGAGSLLNQFAGLANGAQFSSPDVGTFRIFYGANFNSGLTSGGNDVVLLPQQSETNVPEPAGATLLVIGGLGLCRRRNRV